MDVERPPPMVVLTVTYPIEIDMFKSFVVCVNRFHLLLWASITASPYDYVIHIATP